MSDIYLSDLPQAVASAFNVDEFTAGILCSLLTLVMFILPIILAKRGRSNFITELIIGIVVVSLVMALGWLPAYVGLVINLLCAIALSAKLRDWLG